MTSEALVVRRLTFVDSFKKKINIFAIDRRGTTWADGWEVLNDYPEILNLCGKTTAERLDQAFHRWIEPLVKDIRYNAQDALKRWPTSVTECWLWGNCAMQGPVCWVPAKNPCNLYQPGKTQTEPVRFKLQELYNHMRDGYVVMIVEQT